MKSGRKVVRKVQPPPPQQQPIILIGIWQVCVHAFHAVLSHLGFIIIFLVLFRIDNIGALASKNPLNLQIKE